MGTLAALIAAYQETDEVGGGLRAVLPIAGRTLLERQARLAEWAGADPIVILVERVPSRLLEAVDRLRGDGLNVIVARSAAEASDAIGDAGAFLMLADGLVAAEEHVERLMGMGAPSLLTVADRRVDDRFERIDAHSRWAGLALLEGELLSRTAAMLNDWDLQSTLLRRAVQSGARQLALRGDPADDRLTIAERGGDLEDLQARIVEGAGGEREAWVSRYLLAPVERLLVHLLMPTKVTPGWLSFLAVAFGAFAVVAFATGWLLMGMILLLLATPLEGVAERLGAIRMQIASGPSWWNYLFPALAGASLLALSLSLAESRGWGCVVFAAATFAFYAALTVEAGGRKVTGRRWFAEPKAMIWLLLPFAVTGLWATGLGIVACYAAASFFWVQRQVHREAKPGQQD
jgi:hypothetical protein